MESSRVFANNLRTLADWLDGRPEFPMPKVTAEPPYINYGSAKDDFIAAVRVLGSGTKGTGIMDSYLKFSATGCPAGTAFKIECNREGICRLVAPAQPAVWECEPLLSLEEEAQMEAAT